MLKFVVKLKKASGYTHFVVPAMNSCDALGIAAERAGFDMNSQVITVCTLEKHHEVLGEVPMTAVWL